MTNLPSLLLDGLPVSPSESGQSSTPQNSRKGLLQKAIQSRQSRIATKYLWSFYYEKGSSTIDPSQRLTLYNDMPIDNWEMFMRYYNNFPFAKQPRRDTVHWFKHGVTPTWEDARNQEGGAWYFKVSDDAEGEQGPLALELFELVLLMVAAGHLDEFVQPRDDICGVSLTKRWRGYTVAVWTRRADEEKTIQRIREVVLSDLTPSVRAQFEEGNNCYYKKHREHTGFDVELANRLMAEYEEKKAKS